jgi:6-phosphogluconolactonase
LAITRDPAGARRRLFRVFLAAAILIGSASALSADTYVYVSKAPEQTIQIYRLNPADGSLTPVDAVAVDGSPGSLGIDPRKKFLVASLRTTSKLASFEIDPTSGKLKPLSEADLGQGKNAAFVATDRTGRWVLSASYMGGRVVVHRLGDDGKIQLPSVQTAETAVTAHSLLTDRDNKFVFVPHVAPNAVYQFKLNPETGALADAGKAPGGAEKAGPRHIALHPTLNLAFTSDETGSSITAYRLEPEKGLNPVQTLSTLPADFKAPNTTADVKIHPNGKFVWVSNRGHDSLAGFAIDGSGKLSALDRTPTEQTPRSFDLSPDGRYLFGAGEGSGKLAVFKVEPDSGKLTRLHTLDVGKSLTWVVAVQIP